MTVAPPTSSSENHARATIRSLLERRPKLTEVLDQFLEDQVDDAFFEIALPFDQRSGHPLRACRYAADGRQKSHCRGDGRSQPFPAGSQVAGGRRRSGPEICVAVSNLRDRVCWKKQRPAGCC